MSATRGTELAALEAQRNELEVLAEGAYQGERRVVIARLAMIAMFGLVTNLDARATDATQTLVGACYTVWAVAVLVVVWRVRQPRPGRATWLPIGATVIDFALVTTMALLDVARQGAFAPAQQVVASAIVMAFAVARIGPYHVAFSTALAIAGYLIAARHAGELTEHTTIFVIGGFLVLGLMIGITNRAVRTMFAGLRQRDNLTRFLPRQVADRVMKAGPNALAPVEREVTVMFTDIRGFTAMSEGRDPREILAMLDDYFGRMSQVVKGHDGVVGKFLGDGLLAFWGVPDRVEDHASRAVRAARDMQRVVVELNAQRERDGLAPIRIGIGIHTGTVAAGMLGGRLQAEYTVIGDAVNVASRVEQLTKQHGVDALVSETTWNQLAGTRRGERVATAEIRGRKEPVVLYTLDAPASTAKAAPAAAPGRAP